jgi:flagellar protein FlgJ
MTVSKTDAAVYTDLAGLGQLRRGAGQNDPAAIRKVAEQFEGLFTRMMLKSMRDAVGPDPMFGSDQQQMYQGMADDQLSVQLSKGKGLGLADMLVRQLQKMGVAGAEAAGKRTGASGTAAASPGTASISSSAPYALKAGTAAYAAAQADASTTPATAAYSDQQSSFIREMWPHAEQAAQQLGINPRNLLAQAALETNWGRNLPQDPAGRSSNNFFGIKASANWNGDTVGAATREYSGPMATNTTSRFRAYDSPAQSFQDYVALLRGNPRYSAALNTGADVNAFAAGLQRGGYATDPDYARKISAVADALGTHLSSNAATTDLKFGGDAADNPVNRAASGVAANG